MPIDYGFKVSKEGDSVLTAADDRLIFSSKFKTLKVLSPGGTGSVSMTTDTNGDAIQEITHSLGFAPAFIAMRKTSTVQTVIIPSAISPAQTNDDVFVTTDPPKESYNANMLSVANLNGPPAHQRETGIRFPNVTIPQGATIKGVSLQVLASGTNSDSMVIRIRGEKVVDAGVFTDWDNFVARTRTDAYYDWTPPAFTADTSYEITGFESVIQEIVNLVGWVSGNPIELFFKWQSGSADCRRSFRSYDDSFVPPALNIWYEEAATVQNAYFPNVETFNQDIEDFQNSFAYSDANKLYLRMIGASPNTSFTFKYYLFSDLAESYAGAQGGAGDRDWGLKISAFTAGGSDVLTAKPYQLAYSSRFAALKIDNNLVGSGTISLPLLSVPDTEQSEVLDITHGLGYPPLFLAFVISDTRNTSDKFEVPKSWITVGDSHYIQVWAWCDSTKVRIKVWRYKPAIGGSDLPAEVFTIKYYIFREDLSLL